MLREYVVQINDIPHTVQLDEAEAKRIGAVPVEVKQAPVPQNKARTPRSK